LPNNLLDEKYRLMISEITLNATSIAKL
jgi:hypothetical protein